MKKLMMLPIAFLLAAPVFAQSQAAQPILVPVIEEDYIEIDDDFGDRLEQERMEDIEEARMERADMDRSSSDGLDYSDRTRTYRERHAINTSGDASDDQ